MYRIEIWNDNPKGRECLATAVYENDEAMQAGLKLASIDLPVGWQVILVHLR